MKSLSRARSAMSCRAIYSLITSLVTFPDEAAKYPRAHRCRPQNCFANRLFSLSSFRDVLPFQPLDQLAHRGVRRKRDKDIHVIFGNVASQYLNVHGLAYLSNQISAPSRHFSKEYRFAVLCDPHHMHFQIVDAMRGLAVVLHSPNLLTCSPKARDFLTLPEGTLM